MKKEELKVGKFVPTSKKLGQPSVKDYKVIISLSMRTRKLMLYGKSWILKYWCTLSM
uniref:Uncharacterized protein n=1 Tax=Vitis vinifera TaxID=29760 RepID=F6H3L1_VITVI